MQRDLAREREVHNVEIESGSTRDRVIRSVPEVEEHIEPWIDRREAEVPGYNVCLNKQKSIKNV